MILATEMMDELLSLWSDARERRFREYVLAAKESVTLSDETDALRFRLDPNGSVLECQATLDVVRDLRLGVHIEEAVDRHPVSDLRDIHADWLFAFGETTLLKRECDGNSIWYGWNIVKMGFAFLVGGDGEYSGPITLEEHGMDFPKEQRLALIAYCAMNALAGDGDCVDSWRNLYSKLAVE